MRLVYVTMLVLSIMLLIGGAVVFFLASAADMQPTIPMGIGLAALGAVGTAGFAWELRKSKR